MLKKLLTLLSVLIAACVLCIGAYAVEAPHHSSFDELDFIARDGFSTILTDIYGNTYTHDGVLNVRTLEQYDCVSRIASYGVWHGEEQLLSAELHDIVTTAKQESFSGGKPGKAAANGYYSVTFTIDDGTKEVFLTGLTPENLQMVQDAEIEAILQKSELLLEDLAFLDTEKQYDIFDEDGRPVDSDRDMCWAASTSNILAYTGWAQKAGFVGTDYMYENLIREFSDDAGRCYYGLQWFFNGYNMAQGRNQWSQDEAEYGDFNGYLPQYCVSGVAQELNFRSDHRNLSAAIGALRENCGVELNFRWIYYGEDDGGHSITLWGCITDLTKSSSEKDYYYALIVSDSDSDVTHGANRRTAPNRLSVRTITPISYFGYDSWFFNAKSYCDSTGEYYLYSLLSGATTLLPYSPELTTDSGTCDIFTSPDLQIYDAFVYAANRNELETTSFAADDDIGLYLAVINEGGADFCGVTAVDITVCDQAGETVASDTMNIDRSENPLRSHYYISKRMLLAEMLEGSETILSPGDYTLSIAVNPVQGEAFHSNNSCTILFTVSEKKAADSSELTLSAYADYSAGDDAGRLRLNLTGSIGYPVRQYVIELAHNDKEAAKFKFETIYRGSEFPASVPIPAEYAYAGARLTVIPQDGSGFAQRIQSDLFLLNYYKFELENNSDISAYTAVAQGEGRFVLKNEEQIDFTITNLSTLDWNSYRVCVFVDTPDGLVYLLNEKYENKGNEETKQIVLNEWTSPSLESGSYDLYAVLAYEPVIADYYQGYKQLRLGTLSVLPSDYSELTVRADTKDALITDINYKFSVPADASFTVKVLYGGEEALMNRSVRQDYTDFVGGAVSGTLSVYTEPGETVYYKVQLISDDSTITESDIFSFSAPTADVLSGNQPAVLTLSAGESACVAFTVPESGSYELCAVGENGTLSVRDAESGEWIDADISPIGCILPVTAEKDDIIYLRITAAADGTYRLAADPDSIAADPVPLLRPGENSLKLGFGGPVYYQTLRAAEDGVFELTVCGADGSIEYLDNETKCWSKPVYFTTDGKKLSISVRADEQLSVRVTAYLAGEYTISFDPTVMTYGRDANTGIAVFYAQQTNCIAAAYSRTGQLLSVKSVPAEIGELYTVELAGKDIAKIRVFQLTEDFLPDDTGMI